MTKLYAPSTNKVSQAWGAEFYHFNGTDYPHGFYRQKLGWYGHNGIDYEYGPDRNVYAAGDGVVVWADWGNTHSWFNEGGIVTMIDHGDFYTVYAHQDENDKVKVGQRVSAGQIIGTIGGTGMTAGAHLHFEVIPKNPNMGNGWYGRSKPVLVSSKPATVSAASGAITKDWFDMASEADLRKIVREELADNRPKQTRDILTYHNTTRTKRDLYALIVDGGLNATTARNLAASIEAQIGGLVGALKATQAGESFDEAKLLAGVKKAAEDGVANAIASIDTTTTVNIKEPK
jgi:ribosomal protein L27